MPENRPAESWSLGREAERRAQAHLEQKGFTVIGRNLRRGRGELDMVAWDGGTLVFVEVKGRSGGGFGTPFEAVDATKRQRLASAAGEYLAGLNPPPPPCRFDVVAVEFGKGRPRVTHLEDAFRPGDG